MTLMTTHNSIVIRYETAIALYRLGRFDGALLANCLPRKIAEKECPEILRDEGAIDYVAKILELMD